MTDNKHALAQGRSLSPLLVRNFTCMDYLIRSVWNVV